MSLKSFLPISLFFLTFAVRGIAEVDNRCYSVIPLKDEQGSVKPIEPVCRVLENNLNEFCNEPPLVCELKIAPKFNNELAIPAWTPVDTERNLDLVEKIIRGPWMSAKDPEASQRVWEESRPALESAYKQGRLSVSSASLDIFQLGSELKAYRIDAGDCEIKNCISLQINNPGGWSAKLEQPNIRVWPAPEEIRKLEEKYVPLGSATVAGDVFLFQGKPFFYLMYGYYGDDPQAPATNRILVNQGINYISRAGKSRIFFKNVCEIAYTITEDKE